eukprot:TRINITY_DN8726_c0_g1_i1.p1 TRINITY_DN8726_c0_g1~~TRINITY_DN8726_c0_g1_i1.p1  ORF type:complete len:216 (+),score=51.34 TRINITY_DN8726_c0_g1_i1:32-679(+)
MSKALIFVLFAALLCVAIASPIRISCIGDSITQGQGSPYPAYLQQLLGDGFVVSNFGDSGRTLMHSGDYPYWNYTKYQNAIKTDADFVIIQLGTNDAKTWNWDKHVAEFEPDYKQLISVFSHLPHTTPKIYVAIPPPLYKEGVFGMQQKVINGVFPSLITQIARDAGLPDTQLVDMFNKMGGVKLTHPEWSSDGCHPNPQGYQMMAKFFKEALGL